VDKRLVWVLFADQTASEGYEDWETLATAAADNSIACITRAARRRAF